MARCECGRRRPQHFPWCRACAETREARRRAEALAIVQAGRCPWCEAPLVRNSALAGWWQCAAYPEPDRRLPEYRERPACGFQVVL